MKISELEQKIMEEAIANKGSVEFDFHNPIHYQFLAESLGGEAHIKKYAPDVYQQMKRQQTASPDSLYAGLTRENDDVIHLRSYQQLENSTITTPENLSGKSNLLCSISSCLRVCDTQKNFSKASCHFKVYDKQMGEFISEDYYYGLSPDNHGEFMQEYTQNLPLEHFNLGHTYIFTANFTAASTLGGDDALLGGYYVVSHVVTVDIKEKLNQIQLLHPINQNASKRESGRQDLICISYNRDSNLHDPDYSYSVDVSSQTSDLPVHLPISLHVQLKDGASFESINQSYFDYNTNPKFAVKNIDSLHDTAVADGEAVFLASWKDFTSKYVKIKSVNAQNDTLEINFGTDQDASWPKDLECPIPSELWNVSTYACFYAHIVFNIKWKEVSRIDGSEEDVRGSLPVIVQYMAGASVSYTSQQKENTLYIHRLFYQWGCLAKDVLLQGRTGPIAAQDVQINDYLLTREGTYQQVRDIKKGPSPTIFQLTLSCGYTIRLTGDHTLCRADGKPVAASNVRPGDELQIFRTDTMPLDSSRVISIEEQPYEDMVYNFVFDEPTFVVAQGIVVGDHEYQQKIRPCSLPAYQPPKPNEKANLLVSQLDLLKKTPAASDFVESNAPATAMFYYCVLKYILSATTLYSEEEAQEIAQFCAFVESNATHGGLSIDGEAEGTYLSRLHQRGLAIWGDSCQYIKLIPTAMQTWYDHEELKTPYTWTAPSAPPGQTPGSFTFRAKEDILIPFHYPVEDTTPPSPEDTPITVEFDPAYLENMLEDIVEKSKLPQTKAPSPSALHMGIGIALHLLIDTKLHDGYTGHSSWYNLRRTQNIVDHEHNNLTGRYTAYKDYTPEAFDANAEYPAGIEQTGPCVDIPFTMFDYIFPLETAELEDPEIYSGYKTFDNSSDFCDVLYKVTDFLYYYKQGIHIPVNDPTWTNIRDPLIDVLQTSYKSAEECLNCWKHAFSYITFEYDAKEIYDSLVAGENGSYEKLSQYILMLNQIQKGENLYE